MEFLIYDFSNGNGNLHSCCSPLEFPVTQQAPLVLMQLQVAPTKQNKNNLLTPVKTQHLGKIKEAILLFWSSASHTQ